MQRLLLPPFGITRLNYQKSGSDRRLSARLSSLLSIVHTFGINIFLSFWFKLSYSTYRKEEQRRNWLDIFLVSLFSFFSFVVFDCNRQLRYEKRFVYFDIHIYIYVVYFIYTYELLFFYFLPEFGFFKN